MSTMKTLGGPGSGNFGHAGRPGAIGGSSSEGGGGGDLATRVSERIHWNQPVDKNGRPIPIKTNDIEHAARLVHEGKVVEVPTTADAVTLVDRLAAMAAEAKAAGNEAKEYDLCQISVPGTNLFCAEHKDVGRAEMPQLGGKPVPGTEADKLPRDKFDPTVVNGAKQFVDYLEKTGIKTTPGEMPASHLKASQREMIGSKVAKMAKATSFDPGKEPIFVSRDNYVVDGHHRWAANVLRDAEDGKLGDLRQNVIRIDAPISEVLHIANAWSAEFGIAQSAGVKRHLSSCNQCQLIRVAMRQENDMPVEREIHLRAATGRIRTEMYDGREHLVVPVVACMEGVIHAVNASEPEFVPMQTLAASLSGWNGRSVVLGHPTRDGRQISANDPFVLEKHRFGTIFNAKMDGSRLCMEAWIDPKRLETLDPALLGRVKKGETIEVSIGAHVRTEQRNGAHGGKAYKTAWRDLSSDHLAFLPKTRGACSIEMGCGALRAAEGEPEYPVYEITDTGLDEAEKPCGCHDERSLETILEELRTAVGKRHSAADQTMLQTVHDHAVALGATCDPERAASWFADPSIKAFGGPGSGWTAENGHVPGAQGGKGGKDAVPDQVVGKKVTILPGGAHQESYDNAGKAPGWVAMHRAPYNPEAKVNASEFFSEVDKKAKANPDGIRPETSTGRYYAFGSENNPKEKFVAIVTRDPKVAAHIKTVADANGLKSFWSHAKNSGSSDLDTHHISIGGFKPPKGKLKTAAASSKMIDCPHCDGMGQMGTKDCPYCEGEGKVRAASSWFDKLSDKVAGFFKPTAPTVDWSESAEGLKAFGGPGSGWTSQNGHVPGSQGGKGGKDWERAPIASTRGTKHRTINEATAVEDVQKILGDKSELSQMWVNAQLDTDAGALERWSDDRIKREFEKYKAQDTAANQPKASDRFQLSDKQKARNYEIMHGSKAAARVSNKRYDAVKDLRNKGRHTEADAMERKHKMGRFAEAPATSWFTGDIKELSFTTAAAVDEETALAVKEDS